jgi:transcriptional regulator with XRE-family HTH domain
MKADERVARQVGRALRRLRLDQDFLMKQVTGRAGVTVSMLSRYEHGRGCPLSPEPGEDPPGARLHGGGVRQLPQTLGGACREIHPLRAVPAPPGRLRQARRDACLTQAEVGRQIGARQSFVSKVESGERRLDPVELARFAAVYGKPLGGSWRRPAPRRKGASRRTFRRPVVRSPRPLPLPPHGPDQGTLLHGARQSRAVNSVGAGRALPALPLCLGLAGGAGG